MAYNGQHTYIYRLHLSVCAPKFDEFQLGQFLFPFFYRARLITICLCPCLCMYLVNTSMVLLFLTICNSGSKSRWEMGGINEELDTPDRTCQCMYECWRSRRDASTSQRQSHYKDSKEPSHGSVRNITFLTSVHFSFLFFCRGTAYHA